MLCTINNAVATNNSNKTVNLPTLYVPQNHTMVSDATYISSRSQVLLLGVILVVVSSIVIVSHVSYNSVAYTNTPSIVTAILLYDALLTAIGLTFILLPGMVRYALSRSNHSRSTTSSINPGEVPFESTNSTYDCGGSYIQSIHGPVITLNIPTWSVYTFLALDTLIMVTLLYLPLVSNSTIILLGTISVSTSVVCLSHSFYKYSPGSSTSTTTSIRGRRGTCLYSENYINIKSIVSTTTTLNTTVLTVIVITCSLLLFTSSNSILSLSTTYLLLSSTLICLLVYTGNNTICLILLSIVTSNTICSLLLGLSSYPVIVRQGTSGQLVCLSLLVLWCLV